MRKPLKYWTGLWSTLALGLALCTAAAGIAHAAPPIKIEVGYPPGGATDVLARLLASRLSAQLQRDVIVENRSGASGNIAEAYVAHAPADGNTLLFASSTHATNQGLYSQLAYDPDKDFVTMGLVAASSYVLVVNPRVPAHTLQELTSYLKAHPGEFAFASGGAGAGQHLASEFYKKAAQVDIVHVAYKGDAAALPDLIAGRTAMMFDNVGVMLPHIKSGELRPLAVASPQRSSLLPAVPTVAESGYPGFSVVGWFGLLAPARTPANVVDDMHAALDKVMHDPTMIKALNDLGAEPKYASVVESNAFVHEEIVRWTRFIKDLGLKIN